jgi:hypothetical protein
VTFELDPNLTLLQNLQLQASRTRSEKLQRRTSDLRSSSGGGGGGGTGSGKRHTGGSGDEDSPEVDLHDEFFFLLLCLTFALAGGAGWCVFKLSVAVALMGVPTAPKPVPVAAS